MNASDDDDGELDDGMENLGRRDGILLAPLPKLPRNDEDDVANNKMGGG